ncbi:MAG: hypothetical protein AAB110_03880 [Candidatus Desantisbacteria bacterium]
MDIFQLCIVCLTIAIIWVVIIITPAIWQLRKSLIQIGQAASAITTMAEEIKPILTKIEDTFCYANEVISSFKLNMEKIEQIIAKFTGLTDMAAVVSHNPLTKILALAVSMTKGISTVWSKFKK